MSLTDRGQIKILLVLACVGVFGCSHQPPPELVMARDAYQRASNGPAVAVKPDEVHKAYTALQAAERSFADDPDSSTTRDLSYIAERKAELAEALAAAQSAENQRADAKNALEKKQAVVVQQTQRQLGETTQRLGQTQQQLDQARQDSQKTQEQLAQEQDARAAAEQQAKQANDALLALQAKEEARGMVITLSGSVLFTSNESILLPDAQTRLNQVADALLQDKERTVIVEGHTDSRGSAALNQSLSQRRADAVRLYLISRGYPDDRIEAHGIGPDRPVADNKSAEGRANNRRVEIIVPPRSKVSAAP
ncbi:MAG TPA: OmpA family protein [Polyangia bacterium]|jgi:outer membrane protein OmpA-like peptidoglycan-associated protein